MLRNLWKIARFEENASPTNVTEFPEKELKLGKSNANQMTRKMGDLDPVP